MKVVAAIAVSVLVAAPAAARAQSGPFTASLSMREPRTVAFRLGPLMISPNLNLPELGYDSNVFDEDVNPKTDWTVKLAPDLSLYAKSGIIQFVFTAANEFTYYHKYESERSVSRQFRGRFDATLSRVRPWIAAAHIDLHDRPNREIDLRARHTDSELSGGVAFDLSSIANVYTMAAFTESRFGGDEIFKNISLDETMSQRTEAYSAGIELQATPFTSVRFDGTTAETRFVNTASQNARTQSGRVFFEFAPEAVLTGSAHVGVEKFDLRDPLVPDYTGMTSGGSLKYTILERATVEATIERLARHSFELTRRYYVETGADVTYTQRIQGPFDLQGVASRRWLDYTRVTPGLRPRVDRWGAGVGYNLQDGSRIGFNFEYAQRVDEIRPDRTYDRRRFFGTYTVQR